MSKQNSLILKTTSHLSSFALAISIALLIWIIIGHFYRPSFEDQFATFHDGVNLFQVPEGYPESRDKSLDQFEYELYENVRSVSDAVKHIKNEYSISNDEDALHAVFDFTSKRFIYKVSLYEAGRLFQVSFQRYPFKGILIKGYLSKDIL